MRYQFLSLFHLLSVAYSNVVLVLMLSGEMQPAHGVTVPVPAMRWEKVDVSGPSPPGRYNFAYGYDWRRKKVYVYGGR
jgi:hypothetical protein